MDISVKYNVLYSVANLMLSMLMHVFDMVEVYILGTHNDNDNGKDHWYR